MKMKKVITLVLAAISLFSIPLIAGAGETVTAKEMVGYWTSMNANEYYVSDEIEEYGFRYTSEFNITIHISEDGTATVDVANGAAVFPAIFKDGTISGSGDYVYQEGIIFAGNGRAYRSDEFIVFEGTLDIKTDYNETAIQSGTATEGEKITLQTYTWESATENPLYVEGALPAGNAAAPLPTEELDGVIEQYDEEKLPDVMPPLEEESHDCTMNNWWGLGSSAKPAGPAAAILIGIVSAIAAAAGGAAGGAAAGAAGTAAGMAGGLSGLPDPESMVIETTRGAQILVRRDPATGEWINSETGGIVDVRKHQELVRQQEQSLREQRLREAELVRTGKTSRQLAFDEIGRKEKEAFDEIQKRIDARRRKQLERDQYRLESERENAEKSSGWANILRDSARLAGEEVIDTGKEIARRTKATVIRTGEALGTAAGTIIYDPEQVIDQVSEAIDSAGNVLRAGRNKVVGAAKEIYDKPWIVVKGVMDTGKAAVDLATDPKKILKVVKGAVGVESFEKSLDPNLPLIDRLRHTLEGTYNLVTTIGTGGKSASIKGAGASGKAASRLVGAADDMLEVGSKAAAKGAKSATGAAKVVRAGDEAAIQVYKEAQRQGQKKVDDYIDALKSRDPSRIQKAVLEVQADNQAFANLNTRNNFVKNQFNKTMQCNYDKVDRRVIGRLAKERGVNSGDIKVVSATNPNRSLTRVKVGDDRDITFRVNDVDVKAEDLQDIYNEEFMNVTGADARQLRQQAVDRLSAEAYGNQAGDLRRATTGQAHRIADSEQVGKTISYKAHESAAQAAKSGDLMESQRLMYDAMRQTSKQWHNQIESSIAHLNKTPGRLGTIKVPPRLEEAMEIMDQIQSGVSPMEITQNLRALGMTPEDVFTQSGEFFDSMLRLR